MILLLGIDVGTTGTKAVVINERGEVLTKASKEYPLYTPKPGWAEQNVEDWWDAVLTVIQDVLNTEGIAAHEVKALALSGQMHGSVFLDQESRVVRPPILWCDTRTTKQCHAISRQVGEERLSSLVSNSAFEGFTAPKVLWLKEHEPENYGRVRTLLLPKDYINFKLTGVLATEVSDAAGTLFFDVSERRWSDDLLQLLSIDRSILPEVLESTDAIGNLTAEAAKATGLTEKTLVIAGGADNACSAVGIGIIQEGLVSSSIGSSGVVLAHTDSVKLDPKGRVHFFNHSLPCKWYLMGVTLSAGLSLKWFRDGFGHIEVGMGKVLGIDSYDILAQEAATAPPGSEGLIFLPYLNGVRTPHRNAKARGVFFGISTRHGKAHFVRSIMEGVTYELRDSMEIMKELNIPISQVRVTGGGAKSPLWRQIQADVFDSEVAVMNVDEGPAFGAALLAGVGAGVYRDVGEAVAAAVTVNDRTPPIQENVVVYEELYPVFRSLYHSLKPSYDRVFEAVEHQACS